MFTICHRTAQIGKLYSVIYYSRSNISNANISETMRTSSKMLSTTFIAFNIFHQMVPLRKYYSMILTYLFKVNYFKF